MPDLDRMIRMVPYHVIIPKHWFRQKPVFTRRLAEYEIILRDAPSVDVRLDPGNLIYQMMRRLSRNEFEKQAALVHSYRNLVFKMSYVDGEWKREDMNVIHFHGHKNDVMWALSFLSQVYPDMPMACRTVPDQPNIQPLEFYIQNGQYMGANAQVSSRENGSVPDIWAVDEVAAREAMERLPGVEMHYDPNHRPKEKELFALPDSRVAEYVTMDMRFHLAQKYGSKIGAITRHNIGASLMKDFEDMARRQTQIDYELYNVRYSAFMNKAHMLEDQLKGLSASVYDTLPIAERGLPQAPMATVDRTNLMDKCSLEYVYDKVKRNRGHLSEKERKQTMIDTGKSVLSRCRGYNVEYAMYVQTKTPAEVAAAVHDQQCLKLYNDFAKLDSLGELSFPTAVYKVLCNDPEKGQFNMNEVERQIQQIFGRGYAAFLSYQVSHNDANASWKKIYQTAFGRLRKRYLEKQ